MKKLFTLTSLFLMISLVGFGTVIKPDKRKFDDIRTLIQRVQKSNCANRLKSVEVTKQRLDSVVTGGAKNLYTYDSNGKLLVEAIYALDGNNWIGDEKTTYTYNSNGLVAEMISFDWDDDSNDWENSGKTSMEYNSNNLPVLFVGFMWDPDSSEYFKWLRARIISYNADNNYTETVYDVWDSDNNEWIEGAFGSGNYTYDANGLLILSIEVVMGDKYKTENTYDGQENLIKEVESDWDEDSARWILSYKTEYAYQAEGSGWNEVNYEWNSDNSDWDKTSKTIYTFDTDGNLVSRVDLMWNESSNDWENSVKEENVCDNNYSVSDLILPEDCEICDNQIHKITEKKYFSWDNSTTKWDYGGSAIAYYSEHDYTAAAIFNQESVTLFPNPATEFVTVKLSNGVNAAQFDMFDIRGQKVLSKQVENNQKITLSELSSGIYFYNLISENKAFTGKLIKQ